MSLGYREHCCDNDCHGNGDGNSSWRCNFGCVWAKNRTIVSKGEKTRVKWDSKVERKLIDIWVGILEGLDSHLIMRKKKEAIATTRLNIYVSEELGRAEQYTEKKVRNRSTPLWRRERACTSITKRKGTQVKDDADFDMKAAEAVWPNFKTFFEQFKDHPALGPESVDDSAITLCTTVAREEVVEQEAEADTPSGSRCPSRQSNKSAAGDTDGE